MEEKGIDISLLTGCGIAIIVLYPITFYFTTAIGIVGYTIAKIILFVILPIVALFYIEKWNLRDILFNAGVRKENLQKSIVYGLLAAVATILITIFQTFPESSVKKL